MNIPVREDFSAVALVHVFFLPFGKIFQKSSMGDDTKSKEKVIVSSGGIKFFEKNSKRVLQNRGGNLDNQWCGEDFFEFFLKVATQLGDVLEITSVVGECKPPFGGLLLSLKCPKTVPSRWYGWCSGKFFSKKHKKAVLIFKNLEIYLMRINWLDFHAAEKIENFSKKRWAFSDFSHMYCMHDASSMRGWQYKWDSSALFLKAL